MRLALLYYIISCDIDRSFGLRIPYRNGDFRRNSCIRNDFVGISAWSITILFVHRSSFLRLFNDFRCRLHIHIHSAQRRQEYLSAVFLLLLFNRNRESHCHCRFHILFFSFKTFSLLVECSASRFVYRRNQCHAVLLQVSSSKHSQPKRFDDRTLGSKIERLKRQNPVFSFKIIELK